MKLILGLLALALAWWGCMAIIAGHYGIDLHPLLPWLGFVLHYAGPWVALIGGFKLWKQSRLWRRLHHLRLQMDALTRDPSPRIPPEEKPSTLERAAALIMASGAAALLYWFDVPEPEYLLTAALLLWFFRGFAAGILRCQGEGGASHD